MIRIPLVLVALAIAFPASASATTVKCPDHSAYILIKVTDVTCDHAKSVLHNYFKDQVAPGKWECSQKQYPGGVTTTCRKGPYKIKHYRAD